MTREDIQKLVEREIQSVAHEYLKDLHSYKKSQETQNYLNSNSISEDEFDTVFFHGGNQPKHEEPKQSKITIKENTSSNLKITTSEIKDFENSFGEILEKIPGASIVFDKQKNGYSIIATKRPDGVEAKASGIINLGENGKITWSYSILNGFNLNAQNLKLSEGNKTMFEALANHYNDWQKTWREKLNLPAASEPEPTAPQPDAGTQALPGAAMAPAPEPAATTGNVAPPAAGAPAV